MLRRGSRAQVAEKRGARGKVGRRGAIPGIAFLSLLLACISIASVRGEVPEGRTGEPSVLAQKAEKLVREALLARLHDQEERCRTLLEQALTIVPRYPRALWLSGHVWEQGRWVSVDKHQKVSSTSEVLDRYEKMRQQAIRKPERELALARWCNSQGLIPQRDLHFGRLLSSGRLTEGQAKEAIRALDLEFAGGQFWYKSELNELQSRAASAMESLRTWLPQLAEIERELQSDDPARQAAAERRLRAISDPKILPALEAVLPIAGSQLALGAVEILSRNRAHDATLALTRYAILAPAEPVRQAATTELSRRPLHEFVPFLLQSLNAPVRSQFAIYQGPDGIIRYQHHYLRQGREANSIVQANLVSYPGTTSLENKTVVIDDRLPPFTRIAIPDSDSSDVELVGNVALAAIREMQLARDNTLIQQQNARIFPVLQVVSGQQFPYDPLPWWHWWEQYNETPQQRPTQVRQFYDASQYAVNNLTIYRRSVSCFAPGTLVWTERGLRAIESVLPGDRVLSQHPDTGELSYKLVTTPTAGPPGSGMSQMFFGDEAVNITHAHVVWIQGKGWEIVKRTEPGDRLASLGGGSLITDMVDRPVTRLVHNLVVQDFHTFFVGREGILVHDITYMNFRQPTQAIVPGLLAEHVPK
jgi:hypothetical protein